MIQITWTHPRRRMVEVLCERHEEQVVGALTTLGLGARTNEAPDGAGCIRCALEAADLEPPTAYGLVG